MTAITALLTNKAYGYPTRGARRRRKPTILACLHQTANATATAIGETNYANRAGSPGPSATAYIDRDGTIVRDIDPVAYAAWSQGDVASPNTKNPTVAAAVASGVNMNEWVHESIECSGDASAADASAVTGRSPTDATASSMASDRECPSRRPGDPRIGASSDVDLRAWPRVARRHLLAHAFPDRVSSVLQAHRGRAQQSGPRARPTAARSARRGADCQCHPVRGAER